MPAEVSWERYFNASPDDVKDWTEKNRQAQLDMFSQLDPATQAAIKGVTGVNADTGAGS